MNPFVLRWTCEICGGEGHLAAKQAGRTFQGDGPVVHKNPEVCIQILGKKRREMEQQLASLPAPA